MKDTLVVNMIIESEDRLSIVKDICFALLSKNIKLHIVDNNNFLDELNEYNGIVDVIITDGKLLRALLLPYTVEIGELEEVNGLVLSEYNKYNNLNYFISHKSKDKQEELGFFDCLNAVLTKNHIGCIYKEGTEDATGYIVKDIISMLKVLAEQ